MFSGIVQDVGRVQSHEQRGGDVRLVVAVGRLDLARIQPGDSICVQGCCLTATEVQRGAFAVDVSRETLSLTRNSGRGGWGRLAGEPRAGAARR